MRAYAIRDDLYPGKNLAYLMYYEKAKQFYIEIDEKADEWELPVSLSPFLKKGIRSINSYWSRVWVQQRIVPTDRQNLGHILRDNGLKEYDEFRLLVISGGRCAQDSCYIAPVEEKILNIVLEKRFRRKIDSAVTAGKDTLIVFFKDGKTKKCNIKKIAGADRGYAFLEANEEYFKNVEMQPGGNGVKWGNIFELSYGQLYQAGEELKLSYEEFVCCIRNGLVNTAEAAQILGCSRQNIDDLARRGKLAPVKKTAKDRLFLAGDIRKRL